MSLHPDILLIVLDTQRADRLGCYGNPRNLTPNLDRLAAEGALFAQAVAPAQWTVPSHASYLTGLYPTVHRVTQSNQALSPDAPHLVSQLAAAGYETVGFCNNPLVGVLDNGFRRGFEAFYNYGGAAPQRYVGDAPPTPLRRLGRALWRGFQRFASAVQNVFGRSELAFRLSLNTWLTPLWSRYANFKGQNERSVRDLCAFLQTREAQPPARPLFLFLNLMETHLPFWPPQPYLDQTAPYLRRDAQARADMRRWNREAYRWAAPLAEPLPAAEAQLLSDLYDAEVAYQDAYLGPLFDLLRQRARRRDTLTLIVSDHGDGLGEHGCVGHAFVAYQELVHVPLIVHWPAQVAAGLVEPTAVSARRVYHTIGEAAGLAAVERLSLLRTLDGPDPEQGLAYAEVYPPLNFISALAHRQPELLARYRCEALRRAVVRDQFKLIQVEETAEELYDLERDAAECDNLIAHPPLQGAATALEEQLRAFDGRVKLQRDDLAVGQTFALQDAQLLARLRGLGYVE